MSRKSAKNFVPPKQTLLDWIRAVELQKADKILLRLASTQLSAMVAGQTQWLSASSPPKKIQAELNRPKMRRLEISKDRP